MLRLQTCSATVVPTICSQIREHIRVHGNAGHGMLMIMPLYPYMCMAFVYAVPLLMCIVYVCFVHNHARWLCAGCVFDSRAQLA